MNKNLTIAYLTVAFFVVSFVSCTKDGMNSTMAKKIQYRWERFSISSATDYLDGRPVTWTVKQVTPGIYLDFKNDGYYYNDYGFTIIKYRYKVDGDKILSLLAAPSRATTPQYTDTAFIKHVDDHLLVLFHRKYFSSGAYSYMDESIDSLKR